MKTLPEIQQFIKHYIEICQARANLEKNANNKNGYYTWHERITACAEILDYIDSDKDTEQKDA